LRRTIFVLLLLTALLTATPGLAQTDGGPDPASVRVRIGPLWLNPRLELSNLGVDTNVFNEPTDANPKKDFTATVTPSTDLWLRLGRSWLQANVREDLVWYQKYSTERSANNTYAINWKMRLNRLFVTLSPDYLNTRARPGFEIDARSQRTEYGGKADVEVRAFAKTFLAVNGSWRKVQFGKDAIFLGSSLQNELNRTTSGAGVSLRHHLTPLTSISLNVGRLQERFEFSPLRDSNSTAISGNISFDPQALLKGAASFGYRDFEPLSPGVPNYKGTTATGDLSYALLGTTRFGVQFRRDVNYSYDINQPYYLETGVSGSIAQQVFGPFDIVGRFGASSLAYRDRAGAAIEVSNRTDYIRSYGAGAGLHMSKDLRLGFNVDRQHRISDVARREYEGLRYGTAVTYGF
jgi:hypothetical protein